MGEIINTPHSYLLKLQSLLLHVLSTESLNLASTFPTAITLTLQAQDNTEWALIR